MRLWPTSIVVPRGDWVATYPTTNGQHVLGMRLAASLVGFCYALIVYVLARHLKTTDVPDIVPHVLEMLAYFIGAIMGLSIAQYGWKRQTTKPEVVKAVSDAKIAEQIAPGTLTTTTSVSSTTDSPKTDGAR